MAKYYAGIDTSVGVGTETLDGMLTNGSTYGISPSKTIDCSRFIADGDGGSNDPYVGIATFLEPDQNFIGITVKSGLGDAIRILGQGTYDTGELSFYKDNGTDKLGEIEYGVDGIKITSREAGNSIKFSTTPASGGLTERLSIAEDGIIKGTLHTLIGEHSAATTAGQLFSFGNGATDNEGPAMPFAGEVVVVTISKSGGSDAGTFQPSKNGVTQGGADDQITTTTGSGTVTKNNSNYTSLMNFAAGDRINYVTIDATDTTTCLTMVVRFNPS